MSDTQEEGGHLSAPQAAEQSDVERAPVLPLARFAQLLRPQVIENYPNGRPKRFSIGHADEIWLKVLEVSNKGERHTQEEWLAIIEDHKQQPAHPADPNFVRGIR